MQKLNRKYLEYILVKREKKNNTNYNKLKINFGAGTNHTVYVHFYIIEKFLVLIITKQYYFIS